MKTDGCLVTLLILIGLGITAWCVSILLTLQTWESRRYARSRTRQPTPDCQGAVTLIVPCKGKELDAERNLTAFMRQDHPNFDILFAVEDREDPAVEAIEKIQSQFSGVHSRIVVTGRCEASAQKVHNLIVATDQLPKGTDTLAFADFDACPAPNWLRHLVARLDEPRVGAVTGYRWFVPMQNSLPNLMLYSINSALAGLLGPGKHGVVWGGAWAIRREVFDAIDLRTAWQGTLSDDLVANRTIREAGLEVRFEPNCVVTSSIDSTWGQAIEFAQRQYRIARLYLSHWWLAALCTAIVCQLAVWGQLMCSVLLPASIAMRATLAISSCGLVALTLFRAKLRQDLVDVYARECRASLTPGRKFDCCATPLVGFVNLLLLASSIVGRRIRWRGISYLVSTTGRSQLIARRYEPMDPPPVLLKFPARTTPNRQSSVRDAA